jgi:TRAP-type C4-dicarboxylate transport system permease small subunit
VPQQLRPILRTTLDMLYLGAGILAGVFLVAIFVLMMVMSLGREIGLNVPGGDDIASWMMAATAFLGLAHTFKHGDIIRVGLLIDRFSGRTRQVMELACLLIGIGFIAYFTWYAAELVYDSWRFNERAQGVLPWPLWIPQLGFAFGLAVLLIAFVDEFVRVLVGNRPSYVRPPPATTDELIERVAESGV